MKRRAGSTASFVAATAIVGLLAFGLVFVSGVTAVRQLARTQAIEQARGMTVNEARELQLRIADRMVTGFHPAAKARLARIVKQVVQPHETRPVVRVKIWRADAGVGRIVYSDLPELIGLQERLEHDELHVLHAGTVLVQVAPLNHDEERTERGFGALTEVYTRFFTPTGMPLLLETYQRTRGIAHSGRQIAATFTPVVMLTLAAAAAVQTLLAGTLIRRFRRHQRERETLATKAAAASVKERRRIAGDLHDGPIQEMAGLCLSLTAQAESEADEHVRDRLQQMAAAARATLRALRAAIAGIYPPNLERTGLEAALQDLLARLPSHEISPHLDFGLSGRLDHHTSELLYRSSQEAIRNVEKHAHASNLWLSVQRHNGTVQLTVRDDGTGGAVINHHVDGSGSFGLAVLADIIHDADGHMFLISDHTGTTLTVEIPA